MKLNKVSVSLCLFASNEYFLFYFQSGNKYLLSSDPVWNRLIYHYARLGCVVEDYEEFPRSSSNHKVPGSMFLHSSASSNNRKYSGNRAPKRKTTKHQLTKETEEDFYRGTDQEEEMHQRRLQEEELLYSRD